MDTSNLPPDHRCFTTLRKRIPGLFKDEANGRTIFEFVALRAKSYAFVVVEHKVSIRAKGVMIHVIKNHLTLNDHKRCLFASDTNDIDDGESDIELGAR